MEHSTAPTPQARPANRVLVIDGRRYRTEAYPKGEEDRSIATWFSNVRRIRVRDAIQTVFAMHSGVMSSEAGAILIEAVRLLEDRYDRGVMPALLAKAKLTPTAEVH